MWLTVLTTFPPKQGRVHKYSLLNQGEKQKQLTYDGHEGVEVADVEALAGHVDEELDDPSSVLLFHGLWDKQASGVFALIAWQRSELTTNRLLRLRSIRSGFGVGEAGHSPCRFL